MWKLREWMANHSPRHHEYCAVIQDGLQDGIELASQGTL